MRPSSQPDGEAPFFVNPDELFRLGDFFPMSGDTHAAKINSTVRFILIAGSLILLHHYDKSVFYVALAALVLAVVLFGRCTESFEGAPGSGSLDVARAPKPVDRPCQMPTAENPFGNFMLADITDNPDRPGACDPETVKDEIDDQFYANLYRDTTDLFENKNSQRQFFSMPNTRIVNDQTAFARACLGNSGRLRALGQRYFSP